jgi:sortase A
MSSLTPVAPPEDAPPGPEPPPAVVVARAAVERRAPAPPHPFTPLRIAVVVVVWLVASVAAVGLVVYGTGPMLQTRDQRRLLSDYRAEVSHAVGAQNGFSEPARVTTAPPPGDPVAILDVADLHLEQVVVEGVTPRQTRVGPGHVPGTAAPGQPGNSAVVARRAAFGGSFSGLHDLDRGDEILVTTTQGRSVYRVRTVREVDLRTGTGTLTAGASATRGTLTTDDLFDPTDDNRLTLVTSDSWVPWATHRATVVVARLAGRPFEPTPANGRSLAEDGRGHDRDVGAPAALALVAYAATAVAALFVYRRGRVRSAYLLTAPPLVAATFLMAETASRLLPAWF